MASPGFQFKQFYVAHDKCAMKVGTDGTLLGAWAEPNLAYPQGEEKIRILDIGTGSGLVALMLAQRCETAGLEAQIDAIDIDEDAVEQATENFAASPWSNRLHAYLSKLQDWNLTPYLPPSPSGEGSGGRSYDLIVSNPPYFQNSLKNPDKGRELARHTDSLSYEDLLAHSRRLLRDGGHLCIILPAEAESAILRLAALHDLLPEKVLYVHPKPEKSAKRVLYLFSGVGKGSARGRQGVGRGSADTPKMEKQTIYIESAHSPRSEEYAELTKDFYL